MFELLIDSIQTNPYVAPAIMAVFSGTISAFVMYMLKEVPMKIIDAIKTQCYTTLTIQTGNFESDCIYDTVIKQLESYRIESLRRTWGLAPEYDYDVGIMKVKPVAGTGLGVYKYHGRYLVGYKRRILEVDGGQTGKVHEELRLMWLGRNSHPVQQVIMEASMKFEAALNFKADKTEVLRFTDTLNMVAHVNKITLDDIAIATQTKELLRVAIQNHLTGDKAAKTLGIAHKLVILMHGDPGTGKTLLCRAIAGELNRDFVVFDSYGNLNDLATAIHSAKISRAVLTFEDFDTMQLGDKRTDAKTKDDSDLLGPQSKVNYKLATFLNMLDGITPLQGNVVIITTNHLEKIDPAVYRDARVTLLLPVNKLDKFAVQEHLEKVYGPLPELTGYWVPMLGASLHTLKNTALLDRQKVIAQIKYMSTQTTATMLNVVNQ